MKNLCFIASIGLLISACQPLHPEKQQQDFICRSMIQGYLKIQQHTEYKLWSVDMQRPQQIRYTYRPISENGMMISTLKNQAFNFECLQNKTTFQLRLKSQQPLMEFQLPEQNL
ncbi:hypothetical protein IAE19_00145 [Acinetobacter sp. S40]|nr:hypothetical protein [Acinetobacter sp. S40]MBJ9983853.1 hypothetical protein [Acinetobacter sp. S40]